MYWHVLPCTDMYWHVLPCTAMYVLACSATYWYVLTRTDLHCRVLTCTVMYWRVLPCTDMYCHYQNMHRSNHSCFTQNYPWVIAKVDLISENVYSAKQTSVDELLTVTEVAVEKRRNLATGRFLFAQLCHYKQRIDTWRHWSNNKQHKNAWRHPTTNSTDTCRHRTTSSAQHT